MIEILNNEDELSALLILPQSNYYFPRMCSKRTDQYIDMITQRAREIIDTVLLKNHENELLKYYLERSFDERKNEITRIRRERQNSQGKDKYKKIADGARYQLQIIYEVYAICIVPKLNIILPQIKKIYQKMEEVLKIEKESGLINAQPDEGATLLISITDIQYLEDEFLSWYMKMIGFLNRLLSKKRSNFKWRIPSFIEDIKLECITLNSNWKNQEYHPYSPVKVKMYKYLTTLRLLDKYTNKSEQTSNSILQLLPVDIQSDYVNNWKANFPLPDYECTLRKPSKRGERQKFIIKKYQELLEQYPSERRKELINKTVAITNKTYKKMKKIGNKTVSNIIYSKKIS